MALASWRQIPAALFTVLFALVAGDASAQATAAATVERGTMFDHPSDRRLWVSGQVNLIAQFHGAFPSPYQGTNSFRADAEHALSRVWTIYTGLKLRRRVELLVDIESAGGQGLSDALGLAGFTNLDVVRNPSLGSTPYLARAMAHWTIPLTHEETDVTPTALSLASRVPVDRLELRLGKLSLVDFFDLNSVLSDSHLQFTNWTDDNNGAYDYAADTRGYTIGAVAEYIHPRWTLRGAEALMPTVANGLRLDGNISSAHADNVELELRPATGFATRILAYANHANMGSYEEAIEQFRAGVVSTPNIVATRKQGRVKTGVGLNVEYAFPRLFRLAARTGWNEGHHESFAYTEVNNTVQVGGDTTGEPWKRRNDRLGAAFISNGLSVPHAEYLRLGGLGFLLGDGTLSYGRETITEFYYTAYLRRGVSVAVDVQHVTNPGYNVDRGPTSIGTLRLHVDF